MKEIELCTEILDNGDYREWVVTFDTEDNSFDAHDKMGNLTNVECHSVIVKSAYYDLFNSSCDLLLRTNVPPLVAETLIPNDIQTVKDCYENY